MFTVIAKQNINRNIRRLDIKAEAFAAKVKPGHFVAVMPDRCSRSVPFVVYEADWRRKSVAIIFEESDPETRKLSSLKINDPVFRVSGPFGAPFQAEKTGTVVCVGEDLGLVSMAPFCRVLKLAGNKVIGVAGFEVRNNALLESQMRLNCSKFTVMYKDGMHERRGDILAPLNKALAAERVSRVYAAVSVGMLEDVRRICAEFGVSLEASLMPLVSARPVFFETSPVFLGERRYYPSVDGHMVRADKIDFKQIVFEMNSMKEYSECRRKEAASWHRPNVFARLKKFVWG